MATRKINYDTEASITCTLASLAQAAAQECTAVDNSSNLYIDAILEIMIKLQAGSPASDKCINIWFYASEDGTNYGDNATGTTAGVTLRSPNNFYGPFVINTPDSGGLTYKAVITSVARMFGGTLPYKWGFVVENRTNVTFSATEADHTKKYKGVWETVA